MFKRKLYFTCALSGLSLEHRKKMMVARDRLQKYFHLLEFCDPMKVADHEIYHHDIKVCVAEADLMLAIVDERATGLGYEMGVMIEKYGKPVLAVAHHESTVSPLITGIDHPKFQLERYSKLSEIEYLLLVFERKIFGLDAPDA